MNMRYTLERVLDPESEPVTRQELKTHIRSYASAVGLSPDDAVNRFHEIPESPKAEHFDPAALEVDRRARASSAMWATIAGVLVVTMLIALNAMYELSLRFAHR